MAGITYAAAMALSLGAETLPVPVPPSRPVVRALRAALALVVLVGCFAWAQRPLERDLFALLQALNEGQVTSLVVGTVEPFESGEVTGHVEWEDGHGAWFTTYRISTDLGDEVDELAEIRVWAATAPEPVPIETRPNWFGPTSEWNVGAIAGLIALIVLVAGREPRLATRWAWWWLAFAQPLAWAAYLLLEPTPAWSAAPRRTRSRRLTGGWVFVIMFLFGTSVEHLVTAALRWLGALF